MQPSTPDHWQEAFTIEYALLPFESAQFLRRKVLLSEGLAVFADW